MQSNEQVILTIQNSVRVPAFLLHADIMLRMWYVCICLVSLIFILESFHIHLSFSQRFM